jgi:hypothetical protein
MTAQVLSFFQRTPRQAPKPTDWSQQELAEFYRVESALIRAGIRVGTDRGMSDENEPWFCFYRSEDGEVVIHFARIDGEYIIAGPAYEEIARGFDFSGLVRNMVARHPLIRRAESGSNISVHPAALLVAVVGTAFFKTGEARAAESGSGNAQSHHSRPVLLSSSSSAGLTSGVAPTGVQTPTYDTAQLPANQAVLILAAALLASDYGVDASSLDPATRGAISAAAAALDFGSAPIQAHSAEGDFTLTAANHGATSVDNTPAQTVSSVLSLVALLSTLPQLADASSAANVLQTVATDAAYHDPVMAAPPSNEDGNWALDVRLGLGLNGLPSVEAVQLVRSIVGDANAQKISIVEVSKLPDILADLVAKGDHHVVAPPQLTPTTPPPSVTDPVSPPLGDGSTSTPDLPTPPTPPAPVEPAKPAYATPSLVKEFIDYFIAHTSSVEVMVKGADIVMFDARVLHDVGTIGHLYSMTFEFDDGGSISLVGDHSSFLHDGILV